MRTTASDPPAAKYRDPGLHVTHKSATVAPVGEEASSVWNKAPDASESATVPSFDPDASTLSEDVHRKQVIGSE